MLVGALVVFVCAAVVAWVLVGDQSAPGFRPDELDYTIRLEVPASVETTAGIACGAILVAAIIGLVRKRAGWQVVAAALLAGAIVGAGARIVTAGTIGANIGAGLVMFLGGPIALALLAYAIFRATRVNA
jgi:hypothetical protein